MTAAFSIIFNLLGGVRGVIAAIVVAVSVFSLSTIYDKYIDDPLVRRAALKGFTEQAKLEAANARLEEITRQRTAAQDALNMAQKQIDHLRVEQDRQAAATEQEIANYERLLEKDGAFCGLSDIDLEWLRQH